MTASEYLSAMGTSECDDAFACKANYPTDTGGTFEDEWGATTQECYAGAAMYYDAAATQAAITAGKIDFDGAAAATCVAGMAAPTCSTFWDTGPSFPAACDDVMIGKTADGATCAVDFECSGDDSWCDPNTAKCAPYPAGD